MARSYVGEARRRGLGRQARAHRPDHRPARLRARRCRDRVALRERPRAARVGDALGADDRREREQGDEAPVRQVPAAAGLPRGARRGARARHLPDRVLPAEGEVDPRRHARAARGVRRRRAAHDPGAAAAPGRRAQDGERRRGRARRRPGHRRRHACAPALAAAGADAPRRSGEDRARPGAASCPAPTGTASRISSSGTAGASATPARLGARSACSPTCARPGGPSGRLAPRCRAAPQIQRFQRKNASWASVVPTIRPSETPTLQSGLSKAPAKFWP